MPLISLLMIPFMILNAVGGIVSGIWLAVIGEWWAIGLGLAAIFVGTFPIAFALMPGLLFAMPAGLLIERGKVSLALPFVLLSQLYTNALVSVWCVGAFFIFISRATPDTFWPLLIWSYGVAMSPWSYMASKDQGDASTITTAFAQFAYVAIAVLVIFFRSTVLDTAVVFCVIMLIGMIFQTIMAFATLRMQHRYQLPPI